MRATMKRYIYSLLFGAMLSLTSCLMEDPFVGLDQFVPSAEEGLQIVGSAADFDNINVGTRADGEVYPDSYISEMTMFVFDSNGNLLQGYDANQVPTSSAINIQQSNPTFLIEAKKYDGTGIISSMGASLNIKYFDNTADNLSACSIYIVANAYHQISHLIDGIENENNKEIKSLDDLNKTLLSIDNTLAMPMKEDGTVIGFPMIGHAITEDNNVATFNLNFSENASTNAVANIPLTKVYSKVAFTMQVVANQVVKDGPTPKFQLTKVEVFNVPTKAHLGYIAGDYAAKVCNNSLKDDNLGDYYHNNSFTGSPIDLNVPVQTIYHTSSTTITDSDVIKFHFYMPEHMVTPYAIVYPDNIPSERRQYYKPKGVAASSDGTGLISGAKIAPFVRIHGSYTDHNGRIKGVSYDIYLGQNEIDNFEVKRNQQLNNFLTITGLTNHKDAYFGNEGQENISIDHRVTMTDRGYNVYMEREALLDAHFEVRPVDFELQNGSAITIVIPEDYQEWIAMESDAVAKNSQTDIYVDKTNEKRGVRKYFTTDLVSELTNVAEHTIMMDDGRRITTNKEKGTITIEHSSRTGRTNTNTEHFRIWFYIDENPNVYDKTGAGKLGSEEGDYTVTQDLYRKAPVKLYYTNIATDNPNIDAEAVHTINFQQWNLWRVWNSDRTRYYDIEHEEEYLNNYASNQGYGPAQNGMKWGLEGIPLSHQHRSIVASQEGTSLTSIVVGLYASITDMANDALGDEVHYDFYLPRDFEDITLTTDQKKELTIRPYSGYKFNQEIATYLKSEYSSHQQGVNGIATIDKLLLTENPQSAFAYCYNKNKRNPDGTINVKDIKWYLPAIDEIEEIAHGAYAEFDKVFQKEKYWSCQPAYNKESLKAKLVGKINWGTTYLLADYYIDNIDRARATSIEVVVEDGVEVPHNIPSDTPGYSGKKEGNANGQYGGFLGLELQSFKFDLTHTSITISESDYQKKPGNKLRSDECRIRTVYRSGTK